MEPFTIFIVVAVIIGFLWVLAHSKPGPRVSRR